jgi:hypothetical protein
MRRNATEDPNNRRGLYQQKHCKLEAIRYQGPSGMAAGSPGHHAQGQSPNRAYGERMGGIRSGHQF